MRRNPKKRAVNYNNCQNHEFSFDENQLYPSKNSTFAMDKSYSVILITSLPESERMRSRDRDINSILRNTVTDGELVSFKFFCGGLRNLGKCEVFSRPSGI